MDTTDSLTLLTCAERVEARQVLTTNTYTCSFSETYVKICACEAKSAYPRRGKGRSEYRPFGATIVASGSQAISNSYRFSTKYVDDETGLTYYGYRYLSTEMGRWVSQDPIGEDPEYVFVRNRPIDGRDLLGLIDTDPGIITRVGDPEKLLVIHEHGDPPLYVGLAFRSRRSKRRTVIIQHLSFDFPDDGVMYWHHYQDEEGILWVVRKEGGLPEKYVGPVEHFEAWFAVRESCLAKCAKQALGLETAVGVGLVLGGEKFLKKPGALGSVPRTSVFSKMASWFEGRAARRAAGTGAKRAARRGMKTLVRSSGGKIAVRATGSMAHFGARWLPVIGYAFLAWDAAQYGCCVVRCERATIQ